MKPIMTTIAALIIMFNTHFVTAQTTVLFMGNSFTYGYGSATKYY